jgi:4-oxalocrotonate tautomerase
MPYVNATFFEGRLDQDIEARLLEALTDAIVSVFGEPIREQTWVTLEEVPRSRWGFGGKAQPPAS